MARPANRKMLPSRIPLLEWLASALGLLLTLGVLIVIGLDALRHAGPAVPAVEVEVERIVATPAGFVVEVSAVNRSDVTAAAVQLEGQLGTGTSATRSTATLDYVPARSRRKAGLYFPSDPRRGPLRVRAMGYQQP